MKNVIHVLFAQDGNIMNSHYEIKTEFMQFYRGLMGSSSPSLPGIDLTIIMRGPSLTSASRCYLISLVVLKKFDDVMLTIDVNMWMIKVDL